MIRILAAGAVLLTTAAPAQVKSFERSNPAPVAGDPDKIVCKKEESLGTRLGARRVCMTVREWAEKSETHQEFTDKIQSSPRMHRE